MKELILIGNHFSPMVFTLLVSEELAPLQNGDIQEIAVCINPELLVEDEATIPPT
jgi:hypothetical protein